MEIIAWKSDPYIINIIQSHDYYFSLVSWLPVHSWTCHPAVLLPCIKNHQLINLIGYRVKSEIFGVQSSPYFAWPCLLPSLPLFPIGYPMPMTSGIFHCLYSFVYCFVPTDYHSLIPPSLLGQLLFSLQSPREAFSDFSLISNRLFLLWIFMILSTHLSYMWFLYLRMCLSSFRLETW